MPIEKVLTKKSLGILMHPSCIPGGIVCGTFGRGAKEWIKTLHKNGIEYFSLNLCFINHVRKCFLFHVSEFIQFSKTYSLLRYLDIQQGFYLHIFSQKFGFLKIFQKSL